MVSKNRQTQLYAAAIGVLLLLSPSVSAQGHSDHILVQPDDLKWSDVPSVPPGVKVAVIQGPMNEAKPFTVRLKFPENYQLPAHYHPAIEHVTVLSGTFNMGSGDKFDKTKTTALPTGSVLIMPAGMRHYAWTEKETVVQLTGTGPWGITFVDPKDDPRKK